jgi:DNA-binding transcriptional regulator YiaG
MVFEITMSIEHAGSVAQVLIGVQPITYLVDKSTQSGNFVTTGMDRRAQVCLTMDMSTQPELNVWTPEWSTADRLRKIRRDTGYSQDEFAEMLGANPNNYRAWESGRNHPRDIVALAKRIEMLTGVPAAWTLGLADGTSTPGGPGTPKKADSVSNVTPLDYKVAGSATESNIIHLPFHRQNEELPLEVAA